ncbi:hypothetical protein B0H11DRAFT_1913819 [Mycena galericulata]|nr:hypothetical protein B0H11DRAFT_1913819 [Mycena galericulata]
MSSSLTPQPAATDTSHIVHLADPQTGRLSRIPVVVRGVWDVLLSDSLLGSQLRRPFWQPYQDYGDTPFEKQNGDGILKNYLSQLRSNFRVCLQATTDSAVSTERHKIAFIPPHPEQPSADAPRICFVPEHDDAVERIRARVVNSPSADDVAELRQMDIATVAAFLHEMVRLVWLTCHPHSAELAAEKYRGSGAGDEQVMESSLWGGLVDPILADLSSNSEADGLFYESWCPADDATSGRYLSIMRTDFITQYLTRDGAAALSSTIFGDPQFASEIVLGPDVFKTLSIPVTPVPFTGRSLWGPHRSIEPGKPFFVRVDLSQSQIRLPPRRPHRCVIEVPLIDRDWADRLIREDDEREVREAAEAERKAKCQKPMGWMKSML